MQRSDTANATPSGPRIAEVYRMVWRYDVAGRSFTGERASLVAAFAACETLPEQVEVFYDPGHPGFSRRHRATDLAKIRAWFIVAGLAAMAGLVVLVKTSE